MPQEEKLFDIEPEPEKPEDRPDLDRDYFTPGAEVPPQREPSSFQPPEHIRGVPTEAEQREIEHLEDHGFGTIQARQRVLGGNFVDTGLPPNTDTPEKPKGQRQGKRSPAQNPGVRRSPAYDKVPHRDDPSQLPEVSEEDVQFGARQARSMLDGLRSPEKDSQDTGNPPKQ